MHCNASTRANKKCTNHSSNNSFYCRKHKTMTLSMELDKYFSDAKRAFIYYARQEPTYAQHFELATHLHKIDIERNNEINVANSYFGLNNFQLPSIISQLNHKYDAKKNHCVSEYINYLASHHGLVLSMDIEMQ